MARFPDTIDSAIDIFIESKVKKGLTKSSIDFYRDQCRIVFKVLQSHDVKILPHNLTEEQADWYREFLKDTKKKVSTQNDYLAALEQITIFYKNTSVVNTRTRMPTDTRPTVDWLEIDDAKRLIDNVRNIIEEIIIHLELCMGLRRCEILRLRLCDIRYNYIVVTGKGPRGGKIRMVPFHPNTKSIIDRYLKYRESLVKQTRKTTGITDSLIVWRKGNNISGYSESGISKIVDLLGKHLGMKFSNHTLRRSFGRILWKSGVPIETIAKLLGHETTAMTMLYIGVNYDDMNQAMSNFNLR